MGESLGVLLLSGGHERAHYAFVVAAGAAAIGRRVTVFATNEGCRALLRDPASVAGWARDAAVRGRGVAGFEELREAAVGLGVELMACDSGLAMAGLEGSALLEGVVVAGVPAFLAAVGAGAIVTL